MIEDNNKLIWFRRILIIYVLTSLSIAFVLAILIISLCNNKDFNNTPFYYTATIFASTAVGLIPLLVNLNDKIKSNINCEKQEAEKTSYDLIVFGDFIGKADTSFITCTISKFSDFYGLDVLQDCFYTLGPLECIEKIHELINTKSDSIWYKILIKSINKSMFHLEEQNKTMYKDLDEQTTVDLFYKGLLNVLNKIEIICYDFNDFRVNEQVFSEQIGNIIKRIYFHSYFFLCQGGSENQFPNIEKACQYFQENNHD